MRIETKQADLGATYRSAAWLIVIHIVALVVGFGVLGAVFDFPEVLRLPAADRLALYRANQGIIQPIYWVLAMTGFTQVAMAVLLCRSFARETSPLLQIALVFGVLCGLLQMAGFIRWAILIPYLAELMAGADGQTAETLAIIEGVFNRYAGMALGEHAANICLGVWTFGVSYAMRNSKLFDRRLAIPGMALGAAAAILALEQLGIGTNVLGIVLDFVFPLWAVWLLVVAASLLKTNIETGKGPALGWRSAAVAATAYVLLVIPGVGGEAQAQEAQWSPEQQAVIDAVKDGPVGIESDFEAWADGYAEDWTYWRVGDRTTRPRDQHMSLVREFIDAGNRPTAFELEPVDVIIRGDVALLRLIATEELLRANGETQVVRYASAAMLVREDGRWKMLATNIVYLD